jgi:selenocysteine lyase/cysteine desulfurase
LSSKAGPGGMGLLYCNPEVYRQLNLPPTAH